MTSRMRRASAKAPIYDVHVWALAALTVACAFRAYLFFQTDEHFSIIEYTALKLGWSRAEQLSWEHAAAIRPWVQPALYFVIAKLGLLFGLDSRFLFVALFRLFTGALSVVAYVGLCTWSKRSQPPGASIAVSSRFTSPYLLPFLPYLFTRTSAEALSGTLLAFAWIAHFPRGSEPSTECAPATLPRHALLAGFLFGLAFDVRPQTAIFAVAVVLWTLIHHRRPLLWWASLAAGGLAALALLLVVDRWGYGFWVLSPYRYCVVNLVQGKAASYGTDPFYAYAYLLLTNPFALLVAYCLLVLVIAIKKHPRHPASWAVAAFVLVHSVIAHKEDRFLFPMVPFLAVLIPMAFSESRSGGTRGRDALRRFGHVGHATGGLALAAMLVEPYGNSNTGLARELERWGRRDVPVLVVESLDRTIARQPVYERAPWITVASRAPVPDAIGRLPLVYVVAYDLPLGPGECPSPKLRGRCVRRWSEFPIRDIDAHDRWLTRAEAGQEWLRSHFAPSKPAHPTWYGVFEWSPAKEGPGAPPEP